TSALPISAISLSETFRNSSIFLASFSSSLCFSNFFKNVTTFLCILTLVYHDLENVGSMNHLDMIGYKIKQRRLTMKQRIYITRKLPDYIIKPYAEKYDIKMWQEAETPVPREILLKEVVHDDSLFSTLSEQIDRELFDAGKNLKVVSNLTVGFDNIDLAVAREYNVPITNTPDVLTETTADLTFALLMATARRLIEGYQCIQDNNWKNWAPFMRSEEHTSELQSRFELVCRLLLEKTIESHP